MPLFVVATPIGNLEDVTLRALSTLQSADLILCEDTRVTAKLLQRHNIKKPLWSYHQHSKISKVDAILKLLEEEKNIALVSDAGTPGISDPGNFLVAQVIGRFGKTVPVIPIPGPSALAALASVAGISTDRFLFLGFLPAKKGRSKILTEIQNSSYPVIFYESKHKIIKTLDDLARVIPDGKVVVGRELTKMFETLYRGYITEIKDQIETDGPRGEYSLIVYQ